MSIPTICHVLPWGFSAFGGVETFIDDLIRYEPRVFSHLVLTTTFDSRAASTHKYIGQAYDDGRFLIFKNMIDSLDCYGGNPEHKRPDVVINYAPNKATFTSDDSDTIPQIYVSHGCHLQTVDLSSAPKPAAKVIFGGYGPKHDYWLDALRLPVWVNSDDYICKYHRDQPALVAGVIGRLMPSKVPIDFIAALRRADLMDSFGPWMVKFIGSGGNAENIKERLPFCEFTGPFPRKTMPSIMRGLDALIIPSLLEAGPLVAVEAQAAGLPIVYRDVGGIKYTVGGRALSAQSAQMILTHLDTLKSAKLRNELARAGREHVETRRNAVDIFGRFYDLIDNVLGG